MKRLLNLFVVGALVLATCSCEKEKESPKPSNDSQYLVTDTEILGKIHAMGFSTQDVYEMKGEGYLVEKDALVTYEQLEKVPNQSMLIIGNEEQYRTYNTVTGLPRVITVSVSSELPSSFSPALNEALERYNELGLRVSFRRVTYNADISIVAGPTWWSNYGILGQGGFPTYNGDPYHEIKLNRTAFANSSQGHLATVLAHEIGHNIGFRHTDYMDRSFSCGGRYNNEGAGSDGAVHIPGTPSDAEYGSWMLACSNGSSRPFTRNDITALEYLY